MSAAALLRAGVAVLAIVSGAGADTGPVPSPPGQRFDATDLAIVDALCDDEVTYATAGDPTCIVRDVCRERITVSAVHRGGYSTATAAEAVVTFADPCMAHPLNFSGWAVLRRDADSWTRVRTEQGSLGTCVTLPARREDPALLVCLDGYVSQGRGSWGLGWVDVVGNGDRGGTLLALCDSLGAGCGATPPHTPWFLVDEPGLEVGAFAGDERPDVRLRLTAGTVPTPDIEQCPTITWDDDRRALAAGRSSRGGTRRRETLVFETTSRGLEPTAATTEALKRLRAVYDCALF